MRRTRPSKAAWPRLLATGVALIALLACAASRPALAQGAPPADAAATATVSVQVVQADGAPVPDQEVILEWRDRGTRAVRGTWRARTDAEGRAVFTEVDATPDPKRASLRARAPEGAVSHPSPPLLIQDGRASGTITLAPVVTEAEALTIPSLVTILEVPAMVGDEPNFQGLVAVQQLVELKAPPGTAFNGRAGSGLTLTLPEGALAAQGQVVQGSGAMVTGDGQLTYRGVIHPLENGGRAQLMLFYFLRASGSQLTFEQTFPLSIESPRVAFVRDTDLPAFPVLDIGFKDHGFAQITEATDAPMLKGRSVIAGIHPRLPAGAKLRFTAEGLPFGGAPAGAASRGPTRGGSAGPVVQGAQAPRDAIHGGGGGGGEPKAIQLRPQDVVGEAPARVRVRRQVAREVEAPYEPMAGARVQLRWFTAEGNPVEETYESGESDAEGWAVVEAVPRVRNGRRFTLRGFVVENGVRHPSGPIAWDDAAQAFTGEVKMTQVTGEPGAVVGGTLVTILQVPDQMQEHPDFHDFVTVQQVVELTTNTWAIYDTRSAMRPEDANGIAYTVPIKAEGVQAQVKGGLGETKIQDNTITYRGLVFPPDDRYPRVRLEVSFLMKPDGDELEYEQPMSLPFADVRAVFLRDTKLKDHPVIDVDFVDSPFQTITNEADRGTLQGRRVRVARDLATPLRRGDTLSFRVIGLPYPEDTIPYVALGVVLLMALGGVLLGIREVRKARERRELIDRGSPEVIEELDEQIDALFTGLTLLEQDYEDGDLSDEDYATEQERLKTRITMLTQRRAAMLGEEPEGSPA